MPSSIFAKSRLARIGILDHISVLGGSQLVIGHIASVLAQDYKVDIIHNGEGYTLERLSSLFSVNLAQVRERIIPTIPGSFNLPGRTSLLWQTVGGGRSLSQPYDLFIYSGHGVPPFCHARKGLVYCHFPMELAPLQVVKRDARWERRHQVDRWLRGALYRLLWRRRFLRYSRILANSSFSARWIARRWGIPSEVVYPPVELQAPKREKQNIIISVGRFTGKRRGKNQLEQVAAFRQFLSTLSQPWQLCLVGICGEEAEDQEYLLRVRRAAQDLPVVFYINEDRSTLSHSLATAKLFWHTAGLTTNEEENPQEAEHFGIGTVEAMRAGCIPVVIASGGQREIIQEGVSGFLCRDLDELVQKSLTLVCDGQRLLTMGNQVIQWSRSFAKEAFDRRICTIVSQCLE